MTDWLLPPFFHTRDPCIITHTDLFFASYYPLLIHSFLLFEMPSENRPSRISLRKRPSSPRFRFVRPEQVHANNANSSERFNCNNRNNSNNNSNTNSNNNNNNRNNNAHTNNNHSNNRNPRPLLPDLDPDPTCPICGKIILGDLDDINAHIDECVDVPESSGTTSVASSTVPPLPAEQQQSSSSVLMVNIDEEDTRYGAAQYTEKDIERVLAGVRSDSANTNSSSSSQIRLKFDRRAAEASRHTKLLREILESPPMGPELENLQGLLRSLLDQITAAPKCSVCWETLRMPAVTSINCWHVCCEECWLRTLGTKRLCPQCSTITNPEDLRKVY